MPLIYDEGGLLLWQITENEHELEAMVSAEDVASAARFGSGERRCQHLAWRASLRTVLPGAVVGYDSVGAPQVEGRHIGVAHTHGMAAVAISSRPCAVDVESVDRTVGKVRARYISPQEEALADAARDDFGIAMWCAKEVMYKLAGRREIDMLRDLQVTESDLANGTIAGMRMLRVEGYLVVYKI